MPQHAHPQEVWQAWHLGTSGTLPSLIQDRGSPRTLGLQGRDMVIHASLWTQRVFKHLPTNDTSSTLKTSWVFPLVWNNWTNVLCLHLSSVTPSVLVIWHLVTICRICRVLLVQSQSAFHKWPYLILTTSCKTEISFYRWGNQGWRRLSDLMLHVLELTVLEVKPRSDTALPATKYLGKESCQCLALSVLQKSVSLPFLLKTKNKFLVLPVKVTFLGFPSPHTIETRAACAGTWHHRSENSGLQWQIAHWVWPAQKHSKYNLLSKIKVPVPENWVIPLHTFQSITRHCSLRVNAPCPLAPFCLGHEGRFHRVLGPQGRWARTWNVIMTENLLQFPGVNTQIPWPSGCHFRRSLQSLAIILPSHQR